MTPTNEAGHGLPELQSLANRLADESGRCASLASRANSSVVKERDGRLAALLLEASEALNALALSRRVPDAVASRLRGIIAEIDSHRKPATGELRLVADELKSILALAAAPAAAGAQGEAQQMQALTEQRGAVTLDWLREEVKRKGWYAREGTSVPTPDGDWIHPFEVTLPCRDLLAIYNTTPQPAAADGGVRERAREILADAQQMADGHGVNARLILDEGMSLRCNVACDVALRAVSAALSSHRQAGDVAGLWPSIPSIQRWKMECGSDGHRWSVYMDHCKLGEWCKWEEVQQTWFCQALALRNAAPPPGPDLSKFRELAERWRGLANDSMRRSGTWGGKDLADRIEYMADELLALIEKGAGS